MRSYIIPRSGRKWSRTEINIDGGFQVGVRYLRLLEVNQIGHFIRFLHSVMGSILCNLHYLRVNRFGSIRVANNVLSRNHLKPGAGSSISPVSNLQMITVTVECITQEWGAAVLYGCPRRNQQAQIRMIRHSLSCSRYDRRIHRHLVAIIIRETFMSGTGSVCPSLMPQQFSFRTTFLYSCNQISQYRICFVFTGFTARLLQTDIIPVFIRQSLW